MTPTENLNTEISLIRQAIKAVPAVRYALGVAGIFAVIAIVKVFDLNYRVAVFGAIVMFVLMTVLVIFARLAAERKGDFRLPALTFTWFALILTMATALALFTSVFVGWPLKIGPERTVVPSDVRLPSPAQDVQPLRSSPNPSAESTRTLEPAKADAAEPSKAREPVNGNAVTKNNATEIQRPQKLPRPPVVTAEPTNLCCNVIPKQLSSDPNHNARLDNENLDGPDDAKYVRCESDWREIMVLTVVGQNSEKASGTIKFSMSKPEFECNVEQRMDGQKLYKIPKPAGAMLISDKLPDRTEPVSITPGDSPYSFKVNFDAVENSCKDLPLERKVKEGWSLDGRNGCNLGLATAYGDVFKAWPYVPLLEGPYNSAGR
jgi:hypothetical protein